jgi:hypothetical protein
VIAKQRRFDAFLDQHPLPLAPSGVRHLHQPRLEVGTCLLLELLAEGNCEGHRAACNMQAVIRQFAPKAHRRAFKRCLGSERRVRKHLVQVRADHARFDDDIAVVHEHGYQAARIKRLKFRRQMFALGET